MNKRLKSAADLHSHVPPDWYYRSIKENIFQRFWHTRRFEEVAKLIEPSGGRILDIGSADGTFSKVILDKSKADELVGIDVLKTSVDWANRHWRRNRKMKFKLGDAHKLNFKTQSFDAVFMLEVLEHIYQPKNVLKEIKRVLKRKGYAVFLVPSDSILFKAVWFIWTKFRGKIWEHTHIQSFRNNYLSRLVKNAGFKIEEDRKFYSKLEWEKAA